MSQPGNSAPPKRGGSYQKNNYDANIVKPEDLIRYDRYCLSINPMFEPKMQLNENAKFFEFKDHMKEWLAGILRPYARYQFHIETSKKGKYHLHGWVEVDDILGFYTCFMRRCLSQATVELDTIGCPLKWRQYCTKQEALFAGKDPVFTSAADPVIVQAFTEQAYSDKIIGALKAEMNPISRR